MDIHFLKTLYTCKYFLKLLMVREKTVAHFHSQAPPLESLVQICGAFDLLENAEDQLLFLCAVSITFTFILNGCLKSNFVWAIFFSLFIEESRQ